MMTFDLEQMIANRKAECESKARGYVNTQKERKPYYWVEGSTWSNLDSHEEYFFHYTDDDVARIKQLVIDTVNAEQPDEIPVSSVDEALKCFNYGELFEKNEELHHLLGNRCEEADILPDKIDFDTPHYFYTFSYIAYDYENKKVCDPISVNIRLSDDDYITLLALQLNNRDCFCFNQLLNTNPELAVKVSNAVEGGVFGFETYKLAPFMILFDEVRQDAEVIDGPLGTSADLYEETSDDYMYRVVANVDSRILTIIEEDWNTEVNFVEQRMLHDINADKIMNILEAQDYFEMTKKLKQKFSTRSAYDDIKSWLNSLGISFNECQTV